MTRRGVVPLASMACSKNLRAAAMSRVGDTYASTIWPRPSMGGRYSASARGYERRSRPPAAQLGRRSALPGRPFGLEWRGDAGHRKCDNPVVDITAAELLTRGLLDPTVAYLLFC